MKNIKHYYFKLFCLLLLFSGCAKFDLPSGKQQLLLQKKSSSGMLPMASGTYCYACGIIDNMPPVDYDGDSIARPTILGMQHVNPYLVPNMQQAYANLRVTNVLVAATNYYVRFLPNSVQQLAVLDSTMDNQGLDLFDAPMDYDILQEGEYYQDPSIPDSLVTYQYAVVPPNFQFPAGINYTVLAQIHIPGDDYTAVETEAERLAAIQDSLNAYPQTMTQANPNVKNCLPGNHWDDILRRCVPDNCPPGYHWDALKNKCVADNPPPQPPPPAPDAAIAAGTITVSDVNLISTPPVRNVRVVVKRWFKIERLSTDNNGHFQSSKHFKNKAKVVVKFTNGYCNIRGIRNKMLWQILYPVSKTIGVYGSNKNNFTYNFLQYNTSVGAEGNRYWVAATINNAIQEHRDYAAQFGFSFAPNNLNILISNWGKNYDSGMTPLFGKRSSVIDKVAWTSLVTSYLATAGAAIGGDIGALVGSLFGIVIGINTARVDMVINYSFPSVNDMTSDRIKATVYHEASHASQYSKLGNGWYNNLVVAELSEMVKHLNSAYSPYGKGDDSEASVIALSEAWGYHMGHFLADKQYGGSSSCAGLQDVCYDNNLISGLSSHLVALENFNPHYQYDPFNWIPKGVYYDLMDTRNDALAVPQYVDINDEASGYTIQQIFAAYESDVTTMQQYKNRLLQQNNNNQSSQVLSLFQQYEY